jgi:hypothetical protein
MAQERRAIRNLHQPKVQNYEAQKRLNVRMVPAYTVIKNYNPKPTEKFRWRCEMYYVTCSPTGWIDWDVATVYDADSLVGRDNVRVIKD